ncbi:MAG: helix-turn-helix domain-containing protein [Gammaproteobacteria bacterium]|nr:helix-turn-helix domain-containing protein [Gammaproteobacteria bacterium]
MANSFRKLDPLKVWKLKEQGLTNAQIAQRLGVTQGAIYHVLRKKLHPLPRLPEITTIA